MKITDKMRLDFLFSKAREQEQERDVIGYCSRTGGVSRMFRGDIPCSECRRYPRQAIDAAIRAGERNKI